jgi:16S rRNA G966 N2-methylase RsmD
LELEILSPEIQTYIAEHLNADPNDLVLKGIPFKRSLHASILDQIRSRAKARVKLPQFFKTEGIFYPAPLNMEQCSSEITANYKSQLVSGTSLIDLTGGFGVDSYYFSKRVDSVIHCEQDAKLIEIARHNGKVLNSGITFFLGDGIAKLKDLDRQFDWIYLDPSRRSDSKQKVFLLTDCSPNVKTFKGLFLKYARHVMIKTSPLLDLQKTIDDLEYVKTLHIVAVNNEVKELLWILERNFKGSPEIKTINITKNSSEEFNFNFEDMRASNAKTSYPLNYLYEPNAAILKSGAFNLVSTQIGVFKLHQHSHLYTSQTPVEFPGRKFKIEKTIPFNKKKFSKEGIKKANITTRNFPMSVHDIRKKLNIKDGCEEQILLPTIFNI